MFLRTILAPLVFCSLMVARISAADPPAELTAEERARIDRDLKELEKRIDALRTKQVEHLADVDLFRKSVVWALRYDEKFTPADVALIKKGLERGQQRAELLAAGKSPWSSKRGKLVRGHVSEIDGSVQPFGLVIPKNYDPAKPIRLDVVLHGSMRPVGMSELRFLSRFDEEDEGKASTQDFIELHPLGRVENCYRWAGQTDVFEAIEAVCRSYKVDRDRIVLRGMSMGASGTWHLGLKHPDRFVALGPYCGYVDTHRFSETPLGNFVKVGPLPQHQELGLHMLDSIDYAANAGVVPVVAAMGEKDVFFQAHVLMGQAMEKEGLKLVNLIAPGTGHVIEPKTHAEQMRRIGEYAARGIDHAPRHIRFVTWTLKYNRCHWLELLALQQHYARAEVDVRIDNDGGIIVEQAKNVTAFVLHPSMKENWRTLRIGDEKIDLPALEKDRPRPLLIDRSDKGWRCRVYVPGDVDSKLKQPGLQGPIDDAFCRPFLCVRGTGKAWNPAVQAWSDANLKRFAYEWHRYFRGDLPIKDDTAVTEADLKSRNLILFGDPGSNPWIAKVVPKLPIEWTPERLVVNSQQYQADMHVPVLIHPNLLPGAQGKYVVLNSGHTFHEKELASLNYLLFPRLGDWAVIRVGEKQPVKPSEPLAEEVLKAGYFDERWNGRK